MPHADECTMDELGKGSIRLGTISEDINNLLVTENQTKPGLEDIVDIGDGLGCVFKIESHKFHHVELLEGYSIQALLPPHRGETGFRTMSPK